MLMQALHIPALSRAMRHSFRRRIAYAPDFQLAGDCQCQKEQGSGIERKIKANPLLSVGGALVIGYLLAKKR